MEYFNAHCHLELSFLHGAIPPGLPFAEWLERLVPLKRTATPESCAAAAREALAQMRATGTVAMADIISLDLTDELVREEVDFSVLVFREMIQFSEFLAASAVQLARHRQRMAGPGIPGFVHGLSPHAPYTTTGPLLRIAAQVAHATGQWLCIHCAETPEETQMFVHGNGALHDFLSRAGALTDWRLPAMRPVAWLDRHGALGPGTLLVHCNDVTDEEIALIAARRARVVVCPGTHRYFARGPFPLARLLAAGVDCYLGTDSLASNEALNMQREVELAAELSPSVPIETIRRLAGAHRAPEFFEAPQRP